MGRMPAERQADSVEPIVLGKDFDPAQIGLIGQRASPVLHDKPRSWFDEEPQMEATAGIFQQRRPRIGKGGNHIDEAITPDVVIQIEACPAAGATACYGKRTEADATCDRLTKMSLSQGLPNAAPRSLH